MLVYKFNKNKMKAAMVLNGDTQESAASTLKISRQAFANRMIGKTQFTYGELATLAHKYQIKEGVDYFYDKEVKENERA